MGISTHIYLPDNVRFSDVVTVIGIAVGLPTTTKRLSSNSYYISVAGIKGESVFPSYANILFDGRYAFYSFEAERGGRSIIAGGSDFWAAVGRRLVDFFGGYVDYNDCDSVEVDYSKRPKPRSANAPTDGDAWNQFQDRILKVDRIHKDELNLKDNGDGTFMGEGGYKYTFDADGLMIRGEI